MLLLFRSVYLGIFTILYGLASIIAFIFVVPVIVIKERIQLRLAKRQSNRASRAKSGVVVFALASLPLGALLLTGCNAESSLSLQSLDSAQTFKNRAVEFAQEAPPAPINPAGQIEVYSAAVEDLGLELNTEQLSLIAGAAQILGVDPATVALIIEKEIRGLDSGELDRDVVSALAGENTSIGIAQVRLSTAEEIEKEDRSGLLPVYAEGEEERTERIRRLAADDWSILYGTAYVALIGTRFSDDDALALAQRYTGRAPGLASESDTRLYQGLVNLF